MASIILLTYIDEKIETQRGEMTYPKWHNESHLRYNGCSDSIAWAVHCHARERRAEEGEGAGDGKGEEGREGRGEGGWQLIISILGMSKWAWEFNKRILTITKQMTFHALST